MKRIFISVGMTGRKEEDVRRDISRAEQRLKKWLFCDTEVEFVHNYDCVKPDDGGRLWYLGNAIQTLGDCEYCYFVKGWELYRGCKVEREVCKLYGIMPIEES